MYLKLTRLDISWSISRGRDTYGYNICRLDDAVTGKRYKCLGGGYDMIGTVFGEFLNDVYQERLVKLFSERVTGDYGNTDAGRKCIPELYGITLNPQGKAHCDGGCGINSMQRIAEAIGLNVQWIGNKKGHTIGYIVSEPDTERNKEAS